MNKKPMTTAEKFCFYVITLCFAFFAYIVVMSYNTRFTLPTEAGMIMTAVIGLAGSCAGYIVGSNAASKAKDETIIKALDSVPSAMVKNDQSAGNANADNTKKDNSSDNP